LTAALGTVLAFHARNFGRISSYSLMVDTGAVLLLLGTATQLGLICAWALLLSRAVSLVVWAAGLCVIRRRTQSDQVDTATSVGWDLRLATAVLVLGGLSLAGFPLTPGFAARWMALGLLARAQPSTALLLLLGTASSAAGVLYAARVLLALGPHSAEPAPAERWQWVNTVALLLVIAGAVLLSLYPNPLLSAAAGTSGTATYFP
jgi:formate hydrogenlyase subunit 3/multisubunit Na+/H+ antiporter MnhD subunit